MQSLFNKIIADNKDLTFKPGDCFAWNPLTNTIYYAESDVDETSGVWSLLHELGHAKLNHLTNRDDLDLLMMEVAAWGEAQKIAKEYQLVIDEKHIEKCVDSYRSWLHNRSRCIDCQTNSMQANKTTYHCHNCGTIWKVPESAICKIRKTRQTKTPTKL